MISVSEKPRSCSFWIHSTRLTAARIEPKAALGAHGWVEKAELLVEVQRTHGLAGPLGQLADFQERLALRGDVVETLTLTYELYMKLPG